MPKFSVAVSKELEYEVPVEAESEKQARELVQALIDKRDWDFIFGYACNIDFDYDVSAAHPCSDRRFEELANECEVVWPDGTHSMKE